MARRRCFPCQQSTGKFELGQVKGKLSDALRKVGDQRFNSRGFIFSNQRRAIREVYPFPVMCSSRVSDIYWNTIHSYLATAIPEIDKGNTLRSSLSTIEFQRGKPLTPLPF